VNTSNHIQ